MLIISQYQATLDMVENLGNGWTKNKHYFRLDGKTPSVDRMDYCKRFNDPQNKEVFAFLLSIKAGGEGINLVGASVVFVMDVSWNPAQDNQGVARSYR